MHGKDTPVLPRNTIHVANSVLDMRQHILLSAVLVSVYNGLL